MDDLERSGGFVAAMDQLQAALKDIGRVLADYRDELVTHGFDSDDALELCVEVQRSILRGEIDLPEPA